MEWLEALLLECQISIQNFSNAVEMMIKEKIMKVDLLCVDIYVRYKIYVVLCTSYEL